MILSFAGPLDLTGFLDPALAGSAVGRQIR